MEESVNQRINKVIEDSGITLTAFAKMIGIAQTSLRDCVKNGAEPKFSTLHKILIAKPSISAEWLLTGKGNMKKSEFSDLDIIENLKEENISLRAENKLLRELNGLGERRDIKEKNPLAELKR